MDRRLLLLPFLFLALQFGCVFNQQSSSGSDEQVLVNHSDCVGCHEPENVQEGQGQPAEKPADENETTVETETGEQEAGVNETVENTEQEQANQTEENESSTGQNEGFGGNNCEGLAEPDIFTASSVSYAGQAYDDVCVRWDTVKKYYCREGQVKNTNFNCPAGYWCQHGACIEFVGSCTDSDGNDTRTYGYVSIVPAPFASENKYDECEDEATVREWVCQGAEGAEILLDCGSGFKCAEGKCVRSRCEETDGGFVPMVYGETRSEHETLYDRCVDDQILREYYCYGDSIRHRDVRCADRCIDDSCVPGEE